ncbi:hypothetical protein PINS_up014727 [Pythium insidiosum]|nr:hypothetical protein PINS_up014727 [Pythium insidiosum]
MLKAQSGQFSDGGLLTFHLTGSILRSATSDGQALFTLPHRHLQQGLRLALDLAIAFLTNPSCPLRVDVNWSDPHIVHALVRSILSPKARLCGLDLLDLEATIIPIVVETFLTIVPFVIEHPSEPLPIRMTQDSDRNSVRKSTLYKHTVLIQYPVVSSKIASQLPRRGARVLLFGITLDPTTPNDESEGGVYSSEDQSSSTQARVNRLACLRALGDQIIRLNIDIILVQKFVPKYLHLYLASQRTVVFDRLGYAHTRAVQLLSGAAVLGDAHVDEETMASSIGFLSEVDIIEAGEKRFVRFQRTPEDANKAKQRPHADAAFLVSESRAFPVVTIALATTDSIAFEELSHATHVALRRLVAMIVSESENASAVVAGAGCTEAYLAQWLRQHAEDLMAPLQSAAAADEHSFKRIGKRAQRQEITARRSISDVVFAVADALESAVQFLLPSSRRSELQEVLLRLRDPDCTSNQATSDFREKTKLFGVESTGQEEILPVLAYEEAPSNLNDPDNGDLDSSEAESDGHDIERRVVSAFVVDSLSSKLRAIQSAIECAAALARIGGAVCLQPSDTPAEEPGK